MFRRRIPPTPENRPYRCWGYPVVPALYVAIMAAVLVNFFVNPEQRSEALIGLGFIALGACVYLAVFAAGRASRELDSLLLFLRRLGGCFSFAFAADFGFRGVTVDVDPPGGGPTMKPRAASRGEPAGRPPRRPPGESTFARAMAEYQNRSRSRAASASGSVPSSRTSSGSNRRYFNSAASSRQVTPVETVVPFAADDLCGRWRCEADPGSSRPRDRLPVPPRGVLGSHPSRDSGAQGSTLVTLPARAESPGPHRRRRRTVQSYVFRPFYQVPGVTPNPPLHLSFFGPVQSSRMSNCECEPPRVLTAIRALILPVARIAPERSREFASCAFGVVGRGDRRRHRDSFRARRRRLAPTFSGVIPRARTPEGGFADRGPHEVRVRGSDRTPWSATGTPARRRGSPRRARTARPNLFDRVRADSDQEVRSDDAPGVLDREIVLPEMDAVGIRKAGDVGPVVHDEENARLPGPSPHISCPLEQFPVGEPFSRN